MDSTSADGPDAAEQFQRKMLSNSSISRAACANPNPSEVRQSVGFAESYQREARLAGKLNIDGRPLPIMVHPRTIQYLLAARDACNWAKYIMRHGSGNQGHEIAGSSGRGWSAMNTVKQESNMLSNQELLGEARNSTNYGTQCEIIAQFGGGSCTEAAYLTALYLAKEVDLGHLPPDTRIMGVKVLGMDHVQTIVGPSASFNMAGAGDLVIADAWVKDPMPVIVPLGNTSSSFQIHDQMNFETGFDSKEERDFVSFEHPMRKGEALKLFNDVNRMATKHAHDLPVFMDIGYLKRFEKHLYNGRNQPIQPKTRRITYKDPVNRKFLCLDDLKSNQFFNNRQNLLVWDAGIGMEPGELTSPFDFVGALEQLASGDPQPLLDHLSNFPSVRSAVDLLRDLLALGLADEPARHRACTALLKGAAARPCEQVLARHLVINALAFQKQGDAFVSKAVCDLAIQGEALVLHALNTRGGWAALIESVARRDGHDMEPHASRLDEIGASLAGSANNAKVLFEFCESDSLQGMAQMLRFGASPDAETRGRTPLLTDAMARRRDSIAALLVEHGANIDLENESGQEPCAHAAIENMPKLMSALLASNVDVDAVDIDGKRALDHAIAKGHAGIAMQLVRANARLDDQSVEALGKLPLSADDRDDVEISHLEQKVAALRQETATL